MKSLKNILFVTVPVLVVLLIMLEFFFRIVIPASGPPRGYFDEKEKMYFFDNKNEKGIITLGRFAEIRAKWRINNMHWNYPIDYSANGGKKLIAVIGDSYIEAFQVNVDENYPFLLRKKLKEDYEVYAFGISGAALSQYLHISRYVNKHFRPDIVIFNLVHNDFDESIQALSPQNYHFQQISIKEDDSISEILPRPNYSLAQYRPLKRFIYKSSLFRYLWCKKCRASFLQKRNMRQILIQLK
ncbi:MAG: SGNH/GDSL hydrolase family protein [Proteobacteria bacterium]|nr:SGNH/GDSL hydrolase family protein [Pseudomonadota bacterium]